MRAFGDVIVLEVGDVIPAAFCTKLFGQLGCQVIKVERPHSGDMARYAGPYPGDRFDPERSGLFLYLN